MEHKSTEIARENSNRGSDTRAPTDDLRRDSEKPNPYPYPVPKPESEDGVPWRCGDPFQHSVPDPGGDPWGICLRLSSEHDEKNCDAWREEVDKLLIFAGLFSAAVTAFTVESYKMLQTDPQDTAVQLLAQVVAQLNMINGQNSTSALSPTEALAPSDPNSSVVRINICWFLSLTLSLTTVLIGILSMQWLREYERSVNLSPKDAIALRQMRYEGFLRWHVTSILRGLPLLLQAALIFFFAGLLDLLWQLDVHVAAAVTVVVALTMMFLVATTVLPTLQYLFTRDRHFRVPQCPYKSPQSWAFHRLVLTLLALGAQIARHLHTNPRYQRRVIYERLLRLPDWLHFDVYLLQLRDAGAITGDGEPMQQHALVRHDVARGLAWTADTFVQSASAVHAVVHCLRDLRCDDVVAALEVLQHGSVVSLWRLPDALRKTVDDTVHMDVLCAHALDHLCYRNGQLRPALARHRFELYVRINEAIRGRFPTGLECPIRYTEVQVILPEFQIQVLQGIAFLLAYTGSESDLAAAWLITERLLGAKDSQQSIPLPSQVQVALAGFFTAQAQWISHSRSAEIKHGRTTDCLQHMTLFCYRGQQMYHTLRSRFPLALPCFLTLVQSVNKSAGEIGYPEYWTPWALRQWQDFVASVFPEIISPELDAQRSDVVELG